MRDGRNGRRDGVDAAALTMAAHRSRLWQRCVLDEAVVGLPWRIAHQMLDTVTGVHARRDASGDNALTMIAATVDSAAALVDLLHTTIT